ncbi:prenyltransferase [Alteromonas sp. ASW11-36]|uniref:Prenyltransferase n=1 Tax=Alteromonas arenosi TaxID=3055817 RepID=A0ABT7ST86_9ALTE|nr:prenyltransferase [Alteromonas sp. ASW11-36]MDM7859396.1 prenyltransferase [Alteromonas sp. ASW11-36]
MISTIISTMRPNFLILAPLCVSVAWAYAFSIGMAAHWLDVALCYAAALMAHASVNMLNEYSDHHSGLDHNTQRTPFSGGSGALQVQPEASSWVKLIALVLLVVVACIGLYFFWLVGLELMAIGLLAIACVMLYTPTLNKSSLLCFIAPGFGFAVAFGYGSFIAISGRYDITMLYLCVPVFLLVNNLLLLNQFPDREADAQSGRNHLIIKYGERAGLLAYIANVFTAGVATVWLVNTFSLGWAGALLAIPIGAGLLSCVGLVNYIKDKNTPRFMPYMASNVIAALSYPALLCVVLLLS